MFIPIGRAKNLKQVSFQKLSQIRKQIGVSPTDCNNTACVVGFEKITMLSNRSICACEVVQNDILGNIRENMLLVRYIFSSSVNVKKYRKSTIGNNLECSECSKGLLCRGGYKSSVLVRNGTVNSPDPTGCYTWLN